MDGLSSFFFVQLDEISLRGRRRSSAKRRSGRASGRNINVRSAQVECLERRTLLSGTNIVLAQAAVPTFELAHPFATNNPTGYSPSQLQAAYGFNHVSLQNGINGTGQTIAIVDAYHAPTILSDLQAFDRAFGLPDPPSLTVMSQTGSTVIFPPTDPNPNRQLNWEVEAALDVEWAHALAPGARIVLVEANSPNFTDLLAAVNTASHLPGVSVVSMSWGSGEFSSETSFDFNFTTPVGHAGVTFVAASGDSGATPGYPAVSPNVLAIGGTTLTVDSAGTFFESGWSGSGGGLSAYEVQPAFQKSLVKQSTTKRTNPDVAFDADPNTGVPVYASFSNGTSNPWSQIGGTSLSAPAWAAVISIVDQARSQNGLSSLDGPTQTLPMLYQLGLTTPSSFHDITTGSNGFAAGPGYDLVTGIGTPIVNVLVTGLGGASSSASKLIIQQSPTAGTAGLALGTMTVAIENQSGQVVTTDHSTVTVSVASGPGGFTSGSTVSVAAINGVATFTNLVLTVAGNYTLNFSDTGLTGATSHVITISAAVATKLVFLQQPTTGIISQALIPAVTVGVEDQFGNVAITNSSQVTIAVASGPGTFTPGSTILVNAVNGIATFSNLILATAGSYTLKASGTGLAGVTSNSFTINAAQATKLVFRQQPTMGTAGQILAPAITVLIEDQSGNVVTSNSSVVTIAVASGPGLFKSGSTISVNAVNGVATFSNLVLATAGSYTLIASSTSLVSVTSTSFTVVAALSAPLNVTAVALTATTAQVSWNAALGAQGYRVFQVIGSQSVLLGTVSSTTMSFQVSGLTPGATVSFKVEAFSGSAIADSPIVSVTMPTILLNSPILTIRVLTPSSVQLNWNLVSGAQGFRIYWSDGINRLLLGTVGPTVTSVPVFGLQSFATYQFQIEAFQGTTVKDSAWVSVNTLTG